VEKCVHSDCLKILCCASEGCSDALVHRLKAGTVDPQAVYVDEKIHYRYVDTTANESLSLALCGLQTSANTTMAHSSNEQR